MDAIRIFKKCEIFDLSTKTWCGNLQPQEMLKLIEAGAHMEGRQDKQRQKDELNRLKENVKNGKSNPRWYYFTIGKKLAATVKQPKRHDKGN